MKRPRAGHLAIAASLCVSACAGKTPVPPAPTPAPGPPVEPPSFTPEAARPQGLVESRSPYAPMRPAIFEAAWVTVRDKHYDPTLGGVDWQGARVRYEPMALGAPDEPTFYRVVNDMLGELRQSHLFITGPGDEDPMRVVDSRDGEQDAAGPMGDPGLVVREIEDRPTITQVRPESPAEAAGLRPGLVVTHIGGQPLVALRPQRSMRPVEERFYLRRTARLRLSGPVGTRVTVRYLDERDRPVEIALTRQAPEGTPAQFGNLGPLYPEVKISQVGDVGVIAFNFFLLEPVLARVNQAVDQFRARGVRAIVFDLRGNPGGMGAMAIPIAARLVDKPLLLGTMKFRGHENVLAAQPSLGVKPFLGRVFILTDESTASTSEILCAGLQEAGRAQVVGDVTLGAALPSAVEQLPGGAVLQYVVADFRTPDGLMLEGRGVLPDRRVVETRSALRNGRDVVLETALDMARMSR